MAVIRLSQNIKQGPARPLSGVCAARHVSQPEARPGEIRERVFSVLEGLIAPGRRWNWRGHCNAAVLMYNPATGNLCKPGGQGVAVNDAGMLGLIPLACTSNRGETADRERTRAYDSQLSTVWGLSPV